MVVEGGGMGNFLLEKYNALFLDAPVFAKDFVNFLIVTLFIVLFIVFVLTFAKFISKKNIFGLNIRKYKKYDNPSTSKVLGILLYILEYVLLLPFLVFVWFSVFTIFLAFLSEGTSINYIFMLSATVIAAIRIIAYLPSWGEDTSQKVAEVFPLSLLVLVATSSGFFNAERFFSFFTTFEGLFEKILYYFVFIAIIEIFLRLLTLVLSLFGFMNDPEAVEQ